jgi:hypothetical protein
MVEGLRNGGFIATESRPPKSNTAHRRTIDRGMGEAAAIDLMEE